MANTKEVEFYIPAADINTYLEPLKSRLSEISLIEVFIKKTYKKTSNNRPFKKFFDGIPKEMLLNETLPGYNDDLIERHA